MKDNGPQLVIADADGIQEYIFSAHELKLIRGASRIQSELMRDLRKQVPRQPGAANAVLRASGGTLIGRFPSESQATDFRRDAEQLFRRKTASATVTTAAVPDGTPFRQVIDSLYNELQASKRLRTIMPGPRLSPYASVCQKCGIYPASGTILDDAETRIVCASCNLRRMASRRFRQWVISKETPEDFEHIAQGVAPDNYLAIAYFDIDRLGQYMNSHGKTSGSIYRSVSDTIDRAVRESVVAARRAVTIHEAMTEVLLQGGDDAMVALPAGYLIEFIQEFQERFDRFFAESKFARSHDLPKPQFSVGVAIAHSHYPITEFRRIAKEMLASAKKVKGQHSLDYEVITTSMTGHILEARRRAESFGRQRTAKPWILPEWLEFCKGATAIKRRLPSSQVRALYSMAFEGPIRSELEFCYLRARLGSDQQRLLDNAVAPPGVPRDWGSVTGFWLKDDTGRVYTRAADLVEIWDFLHADPTNN